MRKALVLILLAAPTALADPSNGLPTQFRPSFPLFGAGPLTNLGGGDNQALTNASAHIAWSLAIPLAGERIGGRKGLWIAGVSWIVLSIVQESLFHAPVNPGPGYAAEFRTDIITRVVPCAGVLVWDLMRSRD